MEWNQADVYTPTHNCDVLLYFGKDGEDNPDYDIGYFSVDDDEAWHRQGGGYFDTDPLKWADIDEPT